MRVEPTVQPVLPRPLSFSAVSTDEVPRAERYAFWAALNRPFADIEVERDRRADFAAATQSWRIGPVSLVEARSAALRFSRTAGHVARDGLDHWVIRLSLGAPWTAAVGDQRLAAEPWTPVVLRLSLASVTALPAGEWRLLVIPDAACRELSAALARHAVGPLRGPLAGLLADLLAALPRRLRGTCEAEAAPLWTALRAILLACLPPADAGEGPNPARERVERVIAAHLGSARLDAQRVGALAGMSRSALYRLLQDEGGVACVVRRMRLEAILADLTDPALAQEAVAAIAERRGMHSAASFSRAFRRAYGCSPSEARARALRGLPAPRPPAGRGAA